jgi:hypothetical protein
MLKIPESCVRMYEHVIIRDKEKPKYSKNVVSSEHCPPQITRAVDWIGTGVSVVSESGRVFLC